MDERIRSTPPAARTTALARTTIQRIARRAVPALADFVVVFVVAGRSIVSIAAVHATLAGERVLRELRRVYRVRRDDLQSSVARVVRTGRPLMRRVILTETAISTSRAASPTSTAGSRVALRSCCPCG